MEAISVLVVDDHRVFTDALQARLAAEDGLGPITVAYSAAEALVQVQHSPADVAVVDFMLGDDTGAVLSRRLRECAPDTRVIIVSASQSIDAVVDALIAGARAWLPKTTDTAHLVRVIRGVHSGEMWVAPALLGAALPVLLDRVFRPAPDPLAVLTAREREVLDCMIEGSSGAEIAARLEVSANTVRTHQQNLIGKLGAHSALEAVTFALRSGHYPA